MSVERKVRSTLNIWTWLVALCTVLSTMLFIAIAVILTDGGAGHLIFAPYGLLPLLIYLALMLILSIALLVIVLRRKSKLARLRAQGAAHEAHDVVYRRIPWIFTMLGHIAIKAHVVYTDDKGVTHTTKPRQYTISRLFGAVRFDNLEFSATVYVDPYDPADYAVDLRAKVVKQ